MTDDPSVTATYCATLVDEWARRGLRHAVVSPGSRSTPMAVALDADERISVAVHHDERSAAFMALGVGRCTGRPAAVLTTSGTAAVELHPAVVEAHHGCVPLLALTADRPRDLVGTGAPQTIDQRDLFGVAVRWYCEPGIPEARGAPGWRDLACDAYDRTLGAPPGPVHLNLAFAEPLVGFPSGEMPPAIDRPRPADVQVGLTDERLAQLVPLVARERGVIVAGERSVVDESERTAVLDAAMALRWPVLADPLSGLRLDHPFVVAPFDPILRDEGVAAFLEPDVVVRLGGLVASRVTNEWIDNSGAVLVGIDRWGVIPDPGARASHRLEVAPALALTQMAHCRPGGVGTSSSTEDSDGTISWAEQWESAAQAARSVIESQRTGEPAIVAEAVRRLGDGTTLVIASSMPVRDLEWFVPARPGVNVHANRGANGIDGVVSTAVGMALVGGPTVALVGDVAFLHDSNALIGLGQRGVDLAVVVVDNDGGGIFSFLAQATALEPAVFERLFGTPHGTDLAGLASAHHLEVVMVEGPGDLGSVLAEWNDTGGVRILIAKSTRDDNVDVHDRLHRSVADAVTSRLRLG